MAVIFIVDAFLLAIWISPAISPTSPRAPWLLSVTESVALPPQTKIGGHMSNDSNHPKFDLREWLVPPVLLPIFFGLMIAAAVVIQW
jgi:tryptophan-rich sensory protein